MTLALAALALPGCAGRSPAADSIARVVEPQLRNQAQLASDRLEGITAHATALERAAVARGEGARRIAAAARALGEAQTLAAARQALGTVSTAMIAYADASGASLGQNVHVFFCSMAKGSWLQNGTAPKNPYY